MQANISIGMMETSSIARGIEALDAMCKAAGVEPRVHQAISKGKYIIVIAGPVGEVESSLARGAEIAGNTLIVRHIVRNVHAGALAALNKKVKPASLEAVGMVETKEALPALFAADAAAKAAFVHVAEVNTGKGIGGKGYFTVCGEVGAVRTAVAAGVKAIGEDAVITRIVIPNAHEHLGAAI
ncbi:MAG: BMC domain-containing protein [Elusimicrobiales bacterium]|jgi:microcompartment protein CcmL/EutN|nr:BMC domain-containing protein [Elusimicrobiales bacterium]